MPWERKWQPTPVFLPGESQGRGAWWAAVYGVAQSQTRLKRLSSSSSSSSRVYIEFLLLHIDYSIVRFPGSSTVKNLPAMQETWVQLLGWEDLRKKGKATHFSILA